MASESITVTTVGLGNDVDDQLLKMIAETAGGRVRAGAAVLAVNAATRGFRPLRGRVSVTSSHIVLTEPVPDVVEALGADAMQAAAALAGVSASPGRGARRMLKFGTGTVELLDESYNGNPVSVRAMLAVLARTEPARGGRRLLALGDMRELGEGAFTLESGTEATLAEAEDARPVAAEQPGKPLRARVLQVIGSALIGLGVVGFALAFPVAAIIATSDHTNLKGLIAGLSVVVAWSYLGTGLYLWDRRPVNLTGPLMVALGFSWLVSGL